MKCWVRTHDSFYSILFLGSKKLLKNYVKKKIIKSPKKKEKVEVKTDPLRIPKNNEQKPEIKKVKK